jgi:uncharacterized protein YjbI with pentapeptide repeats
MRSCPNESTAPNDCWRAPQAGLNGRLLGTRHRRIFAGSVVVVMVFAMMTTIGLTPTPAFAATTTINGCTIVAHPNQTHFTNCPGADLLGANLAGFNLSFANLSDADIGNCTTNEPPPVVVCTAGMLTGADLKYADLSGASLLGVDLSSANLRHANVSSAALAACFPTSILGGGCHDANVSDGNLTDANLSNAGTSSCFSIDFGIPVGVVSYCGGVSMADDKLTGANLSGDNLSFAVLSNDNLTDATFTSVTFGECPPASKPSFEFCSAADLSGAKLKSVNLSGMQLNGVNFAGAVFSGANLSNANLSPLENAGGFVLIPTNLSGVTWTNTTCPDGTNSNKDGRTCVNN